MSIAQLVKFNSLRKKEIDGTKSSYVRHPESNETPLAIYVVLLLHAHHRDREIIEDLSKLGLCIGYHRVLTISATLGNEAISKYHNAGVVYPLNMERNVFTTCQVDNIDHDPQSTSALTSFHGTGISILQHPTYDGEGTAIEIESASECKTRKVDELPSYFTDVHPYNVNLACIKLPHTNITGISNESTLVNQLSNPDKIWLEHVTEAINQSKKSQNVPITWSAYNAEQSRIHNSSIVLTKTGLLPLFREPAHSAAMMKHAVDMIYKTT